MGNCAQKEEPPPAPTKVEEPKKKALSNPISKVALPEEYHGHWGDAQRDVLVTANKVEWLGSLHFPMEGRGGVNVTGAAYNGRRS